MDQRATQKSCIDKPSHKPRAMLFLLSLQWIFPMNPLSLLNCSPHKSCTIVPQTFTHAPDLATFTSKSREAIFPFCLHWKLHKRVQRRIKSEKLQFWQKLKVTTFFFCFYCHAGSFQMIHKALQMLVDMTEYLHFVSNDVRMLCKGWHEWALTLTATFSTFHAFTELLLYHCTIG